MANYLALIRKADFVDLYKYGSLHINRDMIRQFSCKVEELPNRDPIFTDLSNFDNVIDYICSKRGLLGDKERAYSILLKEFKDGLFGRITLERVL